ncbi:MAG: hypothetical protein CL555_01565 [Algoriphagus sp.]|nr:hypothetical protein [Algoriphagus sp.]
MVDWANDYAKEKKVKPLFTSKNSVFKYIETAKIQKEKAENETNQPQKESEVLFENDQVKISRDPSIDRILVQNPDVPSKAIRDKLKAAAWRWSPTNKAWQRKDTREAVESAKRIFGITELNPDQERMLIIGEKGASRLDQIEEATTRLDNLAVARQMEAEGIQPVFQAYREAMAEVDRLNEAKDFDTDRDYLEAPIERMYAALGYNQYSADREVRGISWVPLNPTQIKSATGNQGTFDPKNPDIRFSRPSTISELNQRIGESRAQELIQAPQGPKPTKKAADIAKKAADFTSTWQNAPQIRTFNSAQEALDSYPELQSRYSIEDMENVPALFIKNPDTGATEAVLIASHSYLSEKGGVEKALLHEVIGHYGIREFLKQQAQGDRKKYVQEYNTLMQQVFDAKKSDRTLADIAKRYFGKEVSQLTANEQIIVGDEYLAHVAQDGVQDKWIDRVVAKLRQILRQLGIKIGLSDAEIRNLIGNSMRIVRGPQGRPVVRKMWIRPMGRGLWLKIRL